MNADLTSACQGETSIQHNTASRELLEFDSQGLPREKTGCEVEGTVFSRRGFWTILASLWLQLMVIMFIAVEISRIETPVADWVSVALRALGID
jgi:hypothetical protein